MRNRFQIIVWHATDGARVAVGHADTYALALKKRAAMARTYGTAGSRVTISDVGMLDTILSVETIGAPRGLPCHDPAHFIPTKKGKRS